MAHALGRSALVHVLRVLPRLAGNHAKSFRRHARRFTPAGLLEGLNKASKTLERRSQEISCSSLELRNRRDAYARWRYRGYLLSISDPARVDQTAGRRAYCRA